MGEVGLVVRDDGMEGEAGWGGGRQGKIRGYEYATTQHRIEIVKEKLNFSVEPRTQFSNSPRHATPRLGKA